MGAFLDKPKTEKHNLSGTGNGLRYGLSSMQGWRVEMEDAHTAMIGLPEARLKDWSFFAVFDGHAGAKVSAYAAEQLVNAIVTNEDFKQCGPMTDDGKDSVSLEKIRIGIRGGFLSLDSQMRDMPEMLSGEDKSGSTAVCVMISPRHIVFANCGDSRGVHARAGKVLASTQDHKPINPVEKERIQNAGGSVMIQRVNGSLAVSRALGDFEYKNVEDKGQCEQMVSPEPEMTVNERKPEEDEFVVLACDGIWDVMSNEEVVDFIRSRMQVTDDLEEICNQVVDTCLYKGSRDNMSIVIVAFDGAPRVSEEAKNKEEELDQLLRKKINDILDQAEPGDAVLSYVMHLLSTEEIEGLPPGGGLIAKRDTVDKIMKERNPQTPNEVE